MKIEASEDKLQYAIEVCRKYRQIRIIAEEAEASWKQNLEMVAESKYPDEKEMYEQQAAEDLAKYTAAREWLELVNVTVAKIHEQKARMVIRQNCLAGSTMKSILMDNGEKRYMSRSTASILSSHIPVILLSAIFSAFSRVLSTSTTAQGTSV